MNRKTLIIPILWDNEQNELIEENTSGQQLTSHHSPKIN